MSARFNFEGGVAVRAPNIIVPEGEGRLTRLTDDQHQELLNYLVSRLTEGNHNRGVRLSRYAKIDKMISTWQKLSASDSERELLEDLTGKSQALPINLPLLATHLEDSVAFYAEVFSPTGRDFYSVPPKVEANATKALAEKMNRDTKARKYYKELCGAFRSLLKYNIGGLAVRWEAGGGLAELSQAGNRVEAIDMYNYLWDSTITDVSKIPTEAEWTARISLKNRMWVTRAGLKGSLERVDKLLESERQQRNEQQSTFTNRLKKEATFYRFAPSHVGLAMDGQDSKTSRDQTSVDWTSYGAALLGDETPEINGFEVIEMYCWLNAKEFGLTEEGEEPKEGVDEKGNGYSLWKFVVIDSAQVCYAEPVELSSDDQPQIPHYLSFLTQDEMKEAQRSMMEMMKGFQRFGSFLLNVYIAAARKNIWGIKGVDPTMFDTSELERGDVAGVLKSKIPGRDVRTGLLSLDNSTGGEEAFQMLTQVMDLVRVFYPNQAQPAQIAGMDRAIKSQVAAVLQGSNRRLHMSCKLLDADLLNPVRVQCYRNLAMHDGEGLEGLNEEAVAKVLGSGLNQLSAEVIAEQLKELIFALFQNPEAMQTFDMNGLLNYWSQIMNSPSDLGEFVRQQQQQQQQQQQPIEGVAA